MNERDLFSRVVDVAVSILGGGFKLRLQDVHVGRVFVVTPSGHGADTDGSGRCESFDAEVGLSCVRGVATRCADTQDTNLVGIDVTLQAGEVGDG